MSRLPSLIRNLFRRREVERDLDEEVRSYFRLLVDEKMAGGIDEAEARRQATLESGGESRVKESVREVRTGARLELVWQEVRYAVRALRKTPGFTTVAVLTIALGTGANTAVFSVVNAVLLRPLPYENAGQTVAVWEKRLRENSARSHVSAADFLDWRRMSRTLGSIALYESGPQSITGGGEAELVPAARVTAGFFEALRVRPLLGRTFETAEEDLGARKVAILTYGTWQRRFGGDARILDRTVHVNGESHQVVGVLPERFRYPFAAACELFLPIRFSSDHRRFRGIHPFAGIARVRDGVTLEQARAEMNVISGRLERQHPDTNAGHVAELVPLHEELAGPVRPALVVLFGAGCLVILIACANVASLLLARATVRARETALRAALGCSRARLMVQPLMESAALALAGAVAGAALAWWGLALLRAAFFDRLDFFTTAGLGTIEVDGRILLFVLGCAVVTTLLSGLSPVRQTLRAGGRGITSARRHDLRSALVVFQVALSVVLLTGAGLLAKSFLRLIEVNPGFEPERVVTAGVNLPGATYRNNHQALTFFDALVERAAALPGVRVAAVTDILPLTGNDNRAGAEVEGRDPRPGERVRLHPRLVSPAYLTTMGIPLLAGRMFTVEDAAGGRHVAIVSEPAARRYWPDGSPVGKRFRFSIENAPWLEVIGVAGAVHNRALDQPATPDVYLPHRETPFSYTLTTMTLVLRSSLDETALLPAIRSAVVSLDRSVAVSEIRSMESHVADAVAPKRFNLTLLGCFAAVAMVLAASGLYGLLSYLVSQRRSEIGIRMALGAGNGDVARLVMGRGLALCCAGIAIGTAASLAAAQVLSKLLFGVNPRDPAVFAAIPPVLIAVAVLASYVPARRATKVDPLAALRAE